MAGVMTFELHGQRGKPATTGPGSRAPGRRRNVTTSPFAFRATVDATVQWLIETFEGMATSV